MDEMVDPFLELAMEVADGERWRLLRAADWDTFQERLAETVGELPPRRRQALMMLLFSLVEAYIEPADVREWLETHEVASDAGVDEMISWLRETREQHMGEAVLEESD